MNTYKEQFDKLTTAYINNEVSPYNDCACFVGNLLQSGLWSNIRNPAGCIGFGFLEKEAPVISLLIVVENGYTPEEIISIENNFLKVLNKGTVKSTRSINIDEAEGHPNYENALFLAFESTLELLKQIHVNKGEAIDETPAFQKRQLQTI